MAICSFLADAAAFGAAHGNEPRKIDEREKMKELIILAAIVVAWYVLNRYVLPKLGVKT